MVEDSDLEEKVLGGKQRNMWKLYRDDLGIAALDSLFVLVLGSVEGTSGEEDEDEESGEYLESREIEGGAPVATKDMEMEVNTVEAAAA